MSERLLLTETGEERWALLSAGSKPEEGNLELLILTIINQTESVDPIIDTLAMQRNPAEQIAEVRHMTRRLFEAGLIEKEE